MLLKNNVNNPETLTQIDRFEITNRLGLSRDSNYFKVFDPQRNCFLGLRLVDELGELKDNASFEDYLKLYETSLMKRSSTFSSLSHPHLLSINEFGKFCDNTYYQLLNPLEGLSLQIALERTGPLENKEGINYLAQIGSALDYLHKVQLCHGSFNLGSILVSSEQKALLWDYLPTVFSDPALLTTSALERLQELSWQIDIDFLESKQKNFDIINFHIVSLQVVGILPLNFMLPESFDEVHFQVNTSHIARNFNENQLAALEVVFKENLSNDLSTTLNPCFNFIDSIGKLLGISLTGSGVEGGINKAVKFSSNRLPTYPGVFGFAGAELKSQEQEFSRQLEGMEELKGEVNPSESSAEKDLGESLSALDSEQKPQTEDFQLNFDSSELQSHNKSLDSESKNLEGTPDPLTIDPSTTDTSSMLGQTSNKSNYIEDKEEDFFKDHLHNEEQIGDDSKSAYTQVKARGFVPVTKEPKKSYVKILFSVLASLVYLSILGGLIFFYFGQNSSKTQNNSTVIAAPKENNNDAQSEEAKKLAEKTAAEKEASEKQAFEQEKVVNDGLSQDLKSASPELVLKALSKIVEDQRLPLLGDVREKIKKEARYRLSFYRAFQGLSKPLSTEFQELLIEGLKDKDYLVRGYAAKALGQVKSEDIQKLLDEHLKTETNQTVRKVIMSSKKGN